MRIFKKVIISILIATIMIVSFIPNTSNAAAITDGQRQALVKVAAQIITEGNKNGILRYSQDHRNSGFSWSKVRSHTKQSTVSTWKLTESDQQRVLAALKEDILKRYPRDEKMQAQAAAMTKLPATSYRCRTLGADIYDTIAFDCSSFCSAVYSMTFGTNFLWTTDNFQKGSSGLFSSSSNMSSAKPGDVLWRKGHVAIYLGDYLNDGNTYIAEAGGISAANTGDKKAEVSKTLADFLISHPTYIPGHPNYNQKNGLPVVELPEGAIRAANKQVVIRAINLNKSGFTTVYSYIGEVRPGKTIDVSGTTTSNTGNSGNSSPTVEEVNNTGIVIGSRTTSIAYWPDNYKLEDQALENSEGYFHKGTPAYGGYTTIVSPLTWLLKKAPDMIDWLAGFITSVLKMEVIGWTSMAENLVSNGLAFGTEDLSAVNNEGSGSLINDTLGGMPVVTTNKITVEDIVFNNVPILDINFFDFDHAAGKDLSPNSIIYKIRSLLAQWYYTIRTLAIIVMLVILLYTTVKAMFTSAVSEKSEAKKKAMDWLVGFIIVFSIHYIMIGTIWMNNQVVETLKPMVVVESGDPDDINNGSITQNNEASLYEQIRIQAYSMSAITGWTGTFMYVAMVIYLCMFVVLYVKRLFILAFLTVISPFVGALYAFNKKTYSINTWLKEYIYNVLIQLIHAIVYTVLISVALNLAKTSTIVGGIFALIMIGFVFTAEKLVKKILGYNPATLGGLSESFAGQLALYMGARKTTKWLGRQAGHAAEVGEHLLEGKRLTRRERIEKAEHESEIRDNLATREAGYRALASISGKALKDLYSNVKDGDPMKGDYMNRLSDYTKNVKKNYKNEYEKYLKNAEIAAYAGSFELQDLMNKRKKEARAARKAFSHDRVRALSNSVIATAGITVGIPMLFLDTKNGVAMTAFGVNSFRNAFTRKTIGGKKTAKTKFRGKKLAFFFASPILAPAYANAIGNSINQREVFKSTYGKEIETLEEARKTEAEIMYKVRQMYGDEVSQLNKNGQNKNIQNKLDALNESILEAEKKDFKRALDASLAKVEEKDVKKVVSEYMFENELSTLSTNDYDNIRDRLNKNLRKKGKQVEISDSFTNNIRDQVRREVGIEKPVEKKTIDKDGNEKTELKARVEVKDIEKICREIAKENEKDVDKSTMKDIVTELKKDKEFNAVLQTQNTEKITEKIKDKLDEKIKDMQIADAISRALEEKMNKEIEEKTEKETKAVEDIISELKASEAVKILTKAANAEGGLTIELNTNRYNDLMKDIKKLDQINEEYKELTGNKIYKDVGQLVQNFRRNLLFNRGHDNATMEKNTNN